MQVLTGQLPDISQFFGDTTFIWSKSETVAPTNEAMDAPMLDGDDPSVKGCTVSINGVDSSVKQVMVPIDPKDFIIPKFLKDLEENGQRFCACVVRPILNKVEKWRRGQNIWSLYVKYQTQALTKSLLTIKYLII
jgi:hypothetical protein